MNRRTSASRFDGKDGIRHSLGAEVLARADEANEETP